MSQWEPQVRTNLDDKLYLQQLDDLLAHVPGSLRAGLVNIRFKEGSFRAPGGKPAPEGELESLLALTAGLFGAEDEGDGENGDEGALGKSASDAFTALGPIDSALLCFREETLVTSRIGGNRALVLTASASLNQGACATLLRSLGQEIGAAARGSLSGFLEPSSEVLVGALVDLGSGEILERYERFQSATVLAVDARLGRLIQGFFSNHVEALGLRLKYLSGETIEVRRAELVTRLRSLHWARMQFDPEHLLVVNVEHSAMRGLVWNQMRKSEIETVRVWVDGLLRYGIKSTMSPFPETQSEFLAIVGELRGLHDNDLLGRLDIGGFANYSVGSGDDIQRCQECIYYLPNGKWCDLPELPIPVEPHWWCRLWKI